METVDLLLVAALNQELAQWLKSCPGLIQKPISCGRLFSGDVNGRRIAALICGVGGERATQSARAYLGDYTPRRVLVAGWAGALIDSMNPGDLLLVENVFRPTEGPEKPIVPDSGWMDCLERILSVSHPGIQRGRLVTVDRMVDRHSVRIDLAGRFKAQAVDMETGYLVPIFQERKIPCACMRVITDTADERIGVDFQALPSGRRRVAYWASHPAQLKNFMRLSRVITKVTAILHQALNAVVQSEDR
jgi:nucleoside phosphorylase